MSPTVYLHIGAPKTGTTYLQDRLGRNASALADHDVHFPSRSAIVSPGLFHFRAALDLLGQDWGGAPGHAEGSWDALVRRVRRKSGSVVISHEILAPANPDARRPRDAGPRARRPRRLHRARPRTPGAGGLAGEHQAGPAVALLLVRAPDGQGQDLVLARLRPPHGARPLGRPRAARRTSTWSPSRRPARAGPATTSGHRFCRVVGIDPAWAPEQSTRANQSLGVAEAAVLRRLNKQLDRMTRREAAYDGLIRSMLAEDVLAAGHLAADHAAARRLRLGRPHHRHLDRVDPAVGDRRRGRRRGAAGPPGPSPGRPGATPTRCRRGSGHASPSTRWPR